MPKTLEDNLEEARDRARQWQQIAQKFHRQVCEALCLETNRTSFGDAAGEVLQVRLALDRWRNEANGEEQAEQSETVQGSKA